MNWDALGSIADMLGALAVLVTLLYLARQVKQSIEAAGSSHNKDIMASYANLNELVASTPVLADLLDRFKDVDSEFTSGELVMLDHFTFRMCNI